MDFISIGHACHDTAPSGFIPGGAVTYAGLLARRLNLHTGILTSFGTDYLFNNLFEKINVQVVPALQTTIFQNDYVKGRRRQHILARASDIKTSDLPHKWLQAKMVFICPIANEVDYDFLNIFENALTCVNLQGWMRRWDKNGLVFSENPEHYDFLAKADIVIISEEDVNRNFEIIKAIAQVSKILVVTKGENGCDIYFKNNKTSFPAYKSTIVDTTGAGDIFSAAFLIYYSQTKNLATTAQYATIAASFCIEARGVSGIPDKAQIELRYQSMKT